MGLKSVNSSWSREDFFKLGFRTATFRKEGTIHSFNDKLTVLVVTGSSMWRQRFKTEAGNGSNSHDFEAMYLIILDNCSSVTGVKWENSVVDG